MIENATGLIVRTRPLTETSLIVHWLTPELGRLATVAKGARRGKSPFAGKLDLFFLADFSFQRSRRSELHALREVVVREMHVAMREELGRVQQASYAAALIEQTTETEAPLPEIFALFSGYLKHLLVHKPRPQSVFAFELKLLGELGLQPDLEQERLRPDIKQLLRVFSTSDWAALEPLKLSSVQVVELERYLHGYLVFHVGKVLNARKGAVATD